MKRSTLAMVLCLVLAVAMGVGSTMAYLQDTDEDVNVMTLGSVYIEQIELERDENGILQEYTQGQPLYPAVYDDENAWAPVMPEDDPNTIHWAVADENGLIDGIPEGAWNGMWDAEKITNVVDKFVFVKNTGKSDAYIRTIYAFEADTTDFEEVNGVDLIHVNWNGNERFDYSQADDRQPGSDPTINIEDVVIDGTTYNLVVVTYRDPVAPGEVIRPSLLQIGMSNLAGNDEVAQFGETFDILVVSQAVQTQGFADAQTALDAAFGKIDADNNPWKKDGEDLPNTPVFPVMVSSADELIEALQNGAEDILYTGSDDIIISEEIELTNKANVSFASAGKLVFEDGAKFVIEAGADVTITGAEIESDTDDEIFVVAGGAVLTLGKGTTIANCNNAMSSGLIRVYGDTDGTGKLVLDGAVIENNNNNGVGSLFNVGSDTEVVINDGTVISGNVFTGKSSGDPNGLFDIYDGKVVMNGGEISGNSFENRTLINLEQNGEFIMNGGEIKNNTYAGTDSGRSVIRLTRTTSFEMNGGTITGNVIPGSSASIININSANVNINDGDITGNTMTYAVYNFGGTVNVNSDATVEGDIFTW